MFSVPADVIDLIASNKLWLFWSGISVLIMELSVIFCYIFISRAFTDPAQSQQGALKDRYSDLISKVLAGHAEKNSLKKLLETRPGEIPAFFSVCSELLSNLKGEKSDEITNLMSMDIVRNYYLKKLQEESNDDQIAAFIYFRDLGEIPESGREVFMKSLDDEKHYIAHASASAILSSPLRKIHKNVFQKMCIRSEDCPETVIELLWNYWNNEAVSYDEKMNLLQGCLRSGRISPRVKGVIVRSMAEFGYAKTGYYLKKVLEMMIDKKQMEENQQLIVSLVLSLGKLKHQESVETISKLTLTNNPAVVVACIDALVLLNSERSKQILYRLAQRKEDYIQKELTFRAWTHPGLKKELNISNPRELQKNSTDRKLSVKGY